MVQKLKMPIKQTHLVCGSFFTNEERKMASLASVIVADGMSSRLYQEVRENLGLAYSVYSSLQQYSQCGVFYIYAAFSPKRQQEVTEALEAEFAFLQSEGITYEEYSRAIEMVKTGYAVDMEDLSTRATRLSKYATFNKPLKSIEEDIIAYQSISFDELNEYIKKQFAWRLWKQILLGKKIA
jgi:predicted Zn-dependent peptidase